MSTGVDPSLDPESTEPALSAGTFTAAATAILGLVALFVPIPVATKAAIMGVIAALAPIVVGVLVRRKVYSPATVQRLLKGR